MTAQEIIQEINGHLAKSDKQYYGDFYIGITNDIERRLFGEHNVPRKGHWRIHKPASNESHARIVDASRSLYIMQNEVINRKSLVS